MNPSAIVVQFDVVGNVLLGLVPGGAHHVMDALVLQAGEERFGEGIVPTYPGAPEGMPEPELVEFR